MPREVVVTGLGMISPVGKNVADGWDSIVAGRSGIGLISRFDASQYEYPIAGEVDGFEPSDHVEAKILRRIDLSTAFAIASAQEAVADAQLEINAERPDSVGILLGTGIGGAHLMVEQQRILEEKGPRRVSPFLITSMLPDTATGLVAIALGARGPNFAVTAACATGGAAVGEAAETIARGEAEVMIAGGFEAPLQPIYYAGFNAMKALATHEDPTQAVRPFDKDRNGFILGEGAGTLILESLEHAQARGAKIYARWMGAATSNDAFDMVAAAEDGRGINEAMRRALSRANLTPDRISYINAHGTGTPLNDRVETRAIRDVFGEDADRVMVSSTKAMHGHMMGASGAVEAVICVLACKHGIAPPTINYTTPDPDCDLDYVPNIAREAPIEYAMSTSVGLGGHNSALIFGHWGGD
ncbi:MAG: beta-ketoacyl-[acyl-carrier-protein] synthase II [Chloroflexi bacterium]|nr:beta-ketoacyl-ACP synthase II [Chloroflexota bacterium]MDA1146411.1 beta-ketoacyl-ACP synthase II [Chloroflexota bacterium]MQC82282.1 beta-ketoacyl-[acyl-carrier-protein] synthase II [Chloroflexota bacterium]MQC82659.1 beta-ketoacyl-[acyl-carrier-protein] synthase II [Chloroflexota bacterium]PKB56722.1 MAG: beta-ketoacyl-[acyl-carrier-protein] synthase II [SAR202 cluster bacterium Casp-Chloro-G1]